MLMMIIIIIVCYSAAAAAASAAAAADDDDGDADDVWDCIYDISSSSSWHHWRRCWGTKGFDL